MGSDICSVHSASPHIHQHGDTRVFDTDVVGVKSLSVIQGTCDHTTKSAFRSTWVGFGWVFEFI